MKAMILAAGRGERMRPLTDHTPKPLLKVGGKPLIVWHLERLAKAGFKEIVINHAHLGQQIEDALGNGAQWGLNIVYSAEKVALETAGGIANALPLLTDNGRKNEPFLVVNGDTYTDFDFISVSQHIEHTALQPQGLSPQNIPAEAGYSCVKANTGEAFSGIKNPRAHLVLVNNPPQHPNGDFAIDLMNQNYGMLKNEGKVMLTFSGVGVYHPDLFADIVIGQPAKLAPLLRAAIAQNAATAQHYTGVWHDIGTPQRLAELDKTLRVNSI